MIGERGACIGFVFILSTATAILGTGIFIYHKEREISFFLLETFKLFESSTESAQLQ